MKLIRLYPNFPVDLVRWCLPKWSLFQLKPFASAHSRTISAFLRPALQGRRCGVIAGKEHKRSLLTCFARKCHAALSCACAKQKHDEAVRRKPTPAKCVCASESRARSPSTPTKPLGSASVSESSRFLYDNFVIIAFTVFVSFRVGYKRYA